MERILIFLPNWMGDVLFSYPFIRAIRKAFPFGHITCVIVPRNKDLLVNNPWINSIYTLSDTNSIFSLWAKLRFIARLRREGYDMCFLLKPSRIKTIMALLGGISERIGFAGKNAPLTKEVEMPSKDMHRADVYLALAGAVDVDKADGNYEYFISEKDEGLATDLLHEFGGGIRRGVAINPGANWIAKRWPAENFVKLARRILASFDDVEIMVTGAEKDIKMADDIVARIGSRNCYSVAGRTDLNELAVLFKRCSLVISADSGPLHLASAVGVTTIGIFGPTSYKVTGPRGKGKNIVISKKVDCEVPCYVNECKKDYLCMKNISVDEIFSAAEQVLSKVESSETK